ncbi:hypothetical protein pipiens_006820 [Culex pipiens pipiens]|uniref:Uncharacterized protein n=1 Tax=Culex pipiens pipiens TaxID=38569 RepID=A0ABD1DS41_CULPP
MNISVEMVTLCAKFLLKVKISPTLLSQLCDVHLLSGKWYTLIEFRMPKMYTESVSQLSFTTLPRLVNMFTKVFYVKELYLPIEQREDGLLQVPLDDVLIHLYFKLCIS